MISVVNSDFCNERRKHFKNVLKVIKYRSTSGSVDFQGAFLSKMFQIIRSFLQNFLIIFIVSHKDLETLTVAALELKC